MYNIIVVQNKTKPSGSAGLSNTNSSEEAREAIFEAITLEACLL